MYRKNVAGQFVCFQLLLTATGAVATGLSPAVRRCIDGTFAAGGGTVTEDGVTGSYKYALSQADSNGNDISFIFTGTGAMPVCINIVTTAADPTDTVRFGLTAMPNVASGSAGALIVSGTGTAALSVSSGLVTLAGVTHTGAVIPTVTTVTNQLTAAAIATGVWTDTVSGDFTTALSVGKSLLNGVALGTGLTVNDITTKSGYSLSASQTFNMTGNITGNLSGSVGSVTGAVGSVTGAVGSVTGAVGSVTARVTANTDQFNGDATSAANIAKTTRAIGRGTASGTPTTTSIPTSACAPAGAATDQFKGRIITFDADTATTALRGQATDITASTNAATPTFTVTALTTAPASGDTFSIT